MEAVAVVKNEYEFKYVNRAMDWLITLVAVLLWVASGVMVTNQFTGIATINIHGIVELLSLCLFIGIGTIISIKVTTFNGIAIFTEAEVEISLRYKKYTIPYEQIRKIRYYTYNWGKKGVIIKTGFFRRLNIREPNGQSIAIYSLYLELNERLNQNNVTGK